MVNALVVYRLLMSCEARESEASLITGALSDATPWKRKCFPYLGVWGTRMTEIVQYACFASICCLIFSNFLINKWQFNLKGLYLCVNKKIRQIFH